MNTKDKIMQSARTRFARDGYEGLSLAAVAEDVGIRKASLYAHIDGKEQLFKQVVSDMANRYEEVWQTTCDDTAGRPPLERIDSIVNTLTSFFSDHETWMLTKRMLLVPPPEFRDYIEEIIGKVETELKGFEKEQFRLAMERGDLPVQPLDELYAAYYCFLDGALLSLFTFEEDRNMRQQAAFRIFKKGVGWDE
ncbi:TetR/AcrR family transcriptional regulator [Exiguobacterium profundum]|uniref:TetR/AcrR family transcriptional regulator n=1 Tax=Exiguobacterium TaxID=33986 RepID=UPI0012F10104|nr:MULTISPECIES: TetR/AcrR family transcriptional regulator [Exiguobacterium]MDX5981381.1 TetR/AcrR family transcriptional regulator [Exiguobacterium profundum]VXB79980.1 Transcriptional regulator, TetR family [Exiguobacterium sp. 8A]VXC06465.1 Transcriptional regulator, TetR family [Exiguobacterium sp. 8H]